MAEPAPSLPAGPPQSNLRGAALLAAGALLFALEIAVLRKLGPAANETQVIFFRAFSQLLLAAAWIGLSDGRALLRTNRLGLHLARGLLSLGSWFFYYASFKRLDMALATTLTFSSSLFVVAMARPLLGERVSGRRLAATLAGFAGVAIVTKVASASFDPYVVLGLLGAVAGGGIILMNRYLGRTENTWTMMFYIGVVTTLGTLPPMLWFWTPLALPDLALVMATGTLGTLGMWLTIEAFRVGEVSALAPVPYVRLVFAIALGYGLFGEVPEWTTLVGAAIIVAAALSTR